ncbi:MAG TPA: peptidoglycan-associated lipoprotein Pal [Burkholderiales bacterium]|nr:peptidoglycan-associated lipoprotein Pal [Burkholderiales bacterium]
MHRTIAAAAVLAAMAGCASTPPASSNASTSSTRATAPSTSTARAPAASSSAAPRASTAGTATGASTVAAPSQRSVFFDYDSNVVKDEYGTVVKSNAQYLASKRGTAVRIEGNTDERGSREYNLALGQRRADAVKQHLTLLGVPAQQIETVSFGEEKPRADAQDEKAYEQNRRADIVYGR